MQPYMLVRKKITNKKEMEEYNNKKQRQIIDLHFSLLCIDALLISCIAGFGIFAICSFTKMALFSVVLSLGFTAIFSFELTTWIISIHNTKLELLKKNEIQN